MRVQRKKNHIITYNYNAIARLISYTKKCRISIKNLFFQERMKGMVNVLVMLAKTFKTKK